MARRPNTGSREQLNREELARLRAELEAMQPSELDIFYKATHNACAYNAMRVPSPRMIQELVQAWRVLRKRKR